MAWLSLLVSYGGFLALALAMPRHHEEILGRKVRESHRPAWRLAGALLLITSLQPALAQWPDRAIAVTAWLGILTVAAFTLAMALTFSAPSRRLAVFGLPVTLALGLAMITGA